MFSTKLEVDRHVDNCLKKINNETERNLRFFSFAKLYFNIGDYEQACRYVSSYLSVKPKSAEAHQLLGRALEKLGKKEAALDAYRTSLQLDPKQNSLVIKVCELLASDDVDMDKSGARYFCELAQTFDPHNSAVNSLKERLITTENDNPLDVSHLLLKELENRPADVNLRVRLLKHFLQNNMIKEAYKHASDIEDKNLHIFHNNISWYEVFAEVLVRYQGDTSLSSAHSWEFWLLSVSVLERLVALSLDERVDSIKSSTEYVAAVFNYDQMLSKAAQNIEKCPDRQLVAEFLSHYHAQLNFHLATLVFKQAKKDLIPFKEASNITLPLLLSAYHAQPADLQSMWLIHAPETRRRLVYRWHKQGAFRCSQAGHILLAAAKNKQSILLEKAAQYSTGMWREQLFKKIFVKRDHQLKNATSYFLTNPKAMDFMIKLPEINDIVKYDEEAQLVHPDSLHHHIWIGLNTNLSTFNCRCFEGLQYSVKNLNNCGAETLNILDIHAFIYCSTLCAKSKLDDSKHFIYYNADKPKVLPAAITELLGTFNQTKFLTAAYKMYKNEPVSAVDDIRLLLIKGIEIVRCVGHHGLDVKLLVSLASIFAERTQNLTKQSEIDFSNARAELYWKTALPLLEKIRNNQVITYSNNRLFEYKNKDMPLSEVSAHIEKGKLFLAIQLFKKKDYEESLKIFEVLKDPYASYYQYQIYKLKADQKTSQNKENVTSEMRSQNIILLSKARDCLYLTLDRLREPSVDRAHPLNTQLGTEIEKMERLLSRIDPDCTNRNECDGMSDENVSSDSAGEHYTTTYSINHTSFQNGGFNPKETHNNHSTPYRHNITRREARPSPERLDAQLRQLAVSRDAAMNNLLEQNKFMVESHRCLIDELRSFKDAVNNLTATVDDLKGIKHGFEELKEIKKSVDDLKNSVDELQNVVDIVKEMKKEITDLKKDSSKNAQSNQLSDEDIYVLDQEYGDININSNLGAFPTNLYPNYQGRISGPGSLAAYGPPGMYPGLYPAMAYAYGGLGLPQPGALPFVPDPTVAPDFRGMAASLSQQAVSYGQALPPVSLGVGMLTGQALSQSLHQPNLVKESPKSTLSTVTSTTQAVFSPMTAANTASTSVPLINNKAPPVNVVITSSDPLPTNKTVTSQPILSVTIPPQHIKSSVAPKSQPHNYQIPLPSSGITTISSTPSVLSKPPPAISTSSLLSNVAPPVFSAVSQSKSPSRNVSLGLQIEKTLDHTFSPSKGNMSLNKSNTSTGSVEEHDPCPDFKPIIPLPDEVPVNTGEEQETVLFNERAKLYRHVTVNDAKEWKERGVGVLKILLNPETGKVRLLMRRDQVHKICANHFITKDMVLTPMQNNDRAYIWAAHDFADEEVVVEKFCARFKTAEDAKKFYNAFESAKNKVVITIGAKNSGNIKGTPKNTSTPKAAEVSAVKTIFTKTVADTKVTQPSSQPANSLGGFLFTGTPAFQPKDSPVATTKVAEQTTPKGSPFSTFTFGKTTSSTSSLFSNLSTDFKPVQLTSTPEASTFSPVVVPCTVANKTADNVENDSTNDDSHADDYVPTAEFQPVVALPDLVEVKTGEENAEVLFECRAKLFRWDTSGDTNEWKERGVGIMKILKENTIRLLMRREQVHKVCCNHQVLKSLSFKLNERNPKAVVWCAQDFSDGVLKPETFTIRFKTEEQASNFLKILQAAQTSLDENSCVSSKHHKPEASPKQTSFGEKFKPAKGSWECKNCYIFNEGKNNQCIACDTPKSGTLAKKSEEAGPVFSFGVAKTTSDTSSSNSSTSFLFGQKPSSPWGAAFRPPKGSWECSSCMVRNTSDMIKCVSCEAPKDGSTAAAPPKSAITGINLETPGHSFSFGIPTTTAVVTTTQSSTSGFGDAFKPKEGSWECKSCYIRNNPDTLYCLSCETPKDDNVPMKETNKGINLDTPGHKFTFGFTTTTPASTTATTTVSTTKTSFSFGDSSSNKFLFGTGAKSLNSAQQTSTKANFAFSASTTQPAEKPKEDKFVFGSPQKHSFEFTPRSPRRISSGQGDEESDGSYVEEEVDNIYFKPVIPLPDKVEVKTGEEQEDVLYCHRAKLFRFVGGEWKERGIGDVKILKNTETGKLRVVMRREQVLKICLNHVLTSEIEYIPKDEKTWLFHAPDYSEGEISHEQFCIRFKNPDVAKEFRKAIDDASNPETIKAGKKGDPTPREDDEVEIVFETKVTPEEERDAIKLGLPPKFFAYRQLPDCKCKQCKKDDEYLKELFQDSSKSDPKPITVSATPVSKTDLSTVGSLFGTPFSNVATPSTGDSVFGTPKGVSSFTFTPTPSVNKVPEKSESLRDLLSKPSLKTDTVLTNSSPNLTTKNNTFGTPSTSTTNLFGTKSEFSFSTSKLGTPETKTTESSALKNFSFSLNTDSKNNIFNPSTTASTTASPALFGSSGLFGTTAKTSVGSSVFSSTGSIFGSATESPSTIPKSTTSIFGNFTNNSTPVSTTNIETGKTSGTVFGNIGSKSTPTLTTNNETGRATESIFGNIGNTSTSTMNVETGKTTTSIFGNSSTATTTTVAETPKATSSIFGTTRNAFSVSTGGSIFGSSSNIFGTTPSVFGKSAVSTDTSIFGSGTPTVGATATANLKEGDEAVLKCESGLSFASLAAKTSQDVPPAFGKSGSESSFAFLGAGAPVFGSGKKSDAKRKDTSKTHSDDEGEAATAAAADQADDEYDPHYEPIIPLPEVIVVSTGEESETALFNERAKLYRYDANSKEWKERGVGQIKVLHHPENNTYRLLLRREQVHKVVLNQLIIPDLDLQPMTTSDRAWMWGGYNYADDQAQLEKLCVRFKNPELAQKFFNVVQDAIVKVAEIQNNKSLPSTVQNYGIDDSTTEEHYTVEEPTGDEDDEEEDEDDEDDRSIMFMKRCTLSEKLPSGEWKTLTMGDIQVYYDPELYAAKISVNDDNGEIVCNTLIGLNTIMELEKNTCTWTAVDWTDVEGKWRTFKAQFSSDAAAQEFHSTYLEGLNYAQELDIVDEIPEHGAEPDD